MTDAQYTGLLGALNDHTTKLSDLSAGQSAQASYIAALFHCELALLAVVVVGLVVVCGLLRPRGA